MTEKSYWWTTGGAGDGASTYTRVDLQRVAEILAAGSQFEGVAPSYLNELAGTVGGANQFDIDTGGGVVDGKPYRSDATVNVTIPSTTSLERIDRVVLRADWTAQTVRVTRIAGTESASPTAPAITQTSGTTYDIKLYQVRVNSSGTVTIELDERVWAVTPVDNSTIEHNAGTLRVKDSGITNAKLATDAVTAAKIQAGAVGSSEIATGAVDTSELAADSVDDTKLRNSGACSVIGRSANSAGNPADISATVNDRVLARQSGALSWVQVAAAMIATGAVTNAKIATGAVDTAELADNAVTNAKIGNAAVDTAQIASAAVVADRIDGGAVGTAQLAADSVDDTKVGNRVPMLPKRQGGHATDWAYVGNSNYTPTAVKSYVGSKDVGSVGASSSSSTITITFPTAFTGSPVILIIPVFSTSPGHVRISSITSSAVQFTIYNSGGVSDSYSVQWLAVGAE